MSFVFLLSIILAMLSCTGIITIDLKSIKRELEEIKQSAWKKKGEESWKSS